MQVQLWNENKHVLKEQFMGDEIVIPAGKHIVMERDDAVRLMGQYNSPEVDGNGQPLPESLKMLKIVPLPKKGSAASKVADKYKCQACSYIATSAADLEDHINSNHLDELDDPDLANKRRKEAERKG